MQEKIDFILNTMKNIAIIGLSPDSSKASYMVGKFLQEKGFNIFPIYPKEDKILNKKVYRNLKEINKKIDTCIMFRKGEFASEIFPLIKEKNIKNFWLQLGIVNNEVARLAQECNINFIQDKCIMLEFQKRIKDDRT
ncbi:MULTISPECIES: CoA-binding protein [unclassified Campylobacter]|uniref:CoA-binding protein n=1 Tax=unclassified Campylobacter TaxID=2593542 RepID=UPI00123800A3|nr:MULTISPECIES: CoA-binding protein [unclassified Campylobacter]KAA6228642.1 CoA-binding protein [Campylobacter sp. LR185c]KAA6229045.1 CoA-binding protein [Campylobacter sp. LR286c]KAA6230199.1 CoA-binding protein [Campylobacter sp. LR291e]KAA8604267.1 CoA-binding protein [Campylobacter sp. LR185c]